MQPRPSKAWVSWTKCLLASDGFLVATRNPRWQSSHIEDLPEGEEDKFRYFMAGAATPEDPAIKRRQRTEDVTRFGKRILRRQVELHQAERCGLGLEPDPMFSGARPAETPLELAAEQTRQEI